MTVWVQLAQFNQYTETLVSLKRKFFVDHSVFIFVIIKEKKIKSLSPWDLTCQTLTHMIMWVSRHY